VDLTTKGKFKMRVELNLMQLHEPLFLAGANLGNKLTPQSAKGKMQLFYDTDLRMGIVIYKGEVALIRNWASINLTSPQDLGITVDKGLQPVDHIDHRIVPFNPHVKAQVSGPEKPVITAQVSNPTLQVQNPPKGRKPKFQGEENQGE
jgi:hypothetical protein